MSVKYPRILVQITRKDDDTFRSPLAIVFRKRFDFEKFDYAHIRPNGML